MSSVRYIDKNGSIKQLEKPFQKKKYNSKFKFEYTDYGLYVAFPILLGVFVGKWLDATFKTTPWGTLGLIVIGGILAIYNLYTLLKK